MSLSFVGATPEKVTVGIGNCGYAFGPGTLVVVYRCTTLPATSTSPCILSLGSSTAARVNLITAANSSSQRVWAFSVDAAAVSNSPTATQFVAGRWYLVAVTKATGTVTPFFTVWDYTANAYALFNVAGSATAANSTAGTTSCTIGATSTATGGVDGDIAVCAAWDVVLSSAQIDSLIRDISYSNWSAGVKPRGFWYPTPASVVDMTGGGANETGRTGTVQTKDEFPLLDPSTPWFGRSSYSAGQS